MNPAFFDPASHDGPLPSPCIDVCRMNPATGWCEGCWRNIDEIAQWGVADEAFKHRVWIEIKRRQALQDHR